ncbi:hypothetical protein [Alkalihalobacillus sp. AL-G]|uniref:hypothetical protein n=1 Tax=Alkalihalobacillus sp. AL-G TaxID=2926399 RepID=UPI00272B4847|nr:hypothetical protein [Alkalihalobacillus sp. AL-G]WLD92580.1 hypothetical protein MOJ78_16400 [Alkalihalobacillus sp. AL-G]
MEFSLKCKASVFPCEVTIDEDNGRYMLRKADSSGEFFNTPEELARWVFKNWSLDDFDEIDSFQKMLKILESYLHTKTN